MATSAYCGGTGAGKTYEVVKEVLIPALEAGRRVVTNVAGIHDDAIRAYLISRGASEEKLGSVVHVTSEQVKGEGFWPHDGRETTLHPGDLVILDEAWQWMMVGKAIPDDMFAFFRMHRHGVDESGFTGDAVLLTQSINDVDMKVRRIITSHFVMEKLTRLGTSKGYTVDCYSGYQSYKRNHLRRLFRYYDSTFFQFYESYDGKGATEAVVDKRVNIWRHPGLLLMFIGGPLLFLGSGVAVWRMYDKKVNPPAQSKASSVPAAVPVAVASVASSSAPKPGVGISGGVSDIPRGGIDPGGSPDWRVVGQYVGAGRSVFILQSGQQVRYVQAVDGVRVGGQQVEIMINGKIYTSYGGSAGGGSSAGGGGVFGGRR